VHKIKVKQLFYNAISEYIWYLVFMILTAFLSLTSH